ncbi:hypothetical protein TWF225_008116 [Orbilia oligospora]|nr:hypothetical protein TWF225_008116 [Orbilia oligospora]KAF3261334.1 hypothetical protein TWF128_003107 [Orbilia oligospora]KAF3268825.1 hypothetical protein TWF217_010119 [Orbilia oligospora]
MKSRYILAGAGLLHSARAIPAYITTVFSCPDVVTITQTVYPPGWTNTGPIYTTRPLTEPQPNPPPNPRPEPEGNRTPQPQCTEQGLTTSWETEYATRTMYYSEYGMYSGPPGCPPTIYAYMPTTVTCSEPQTTGWVGYASDIACASCTATTLVGLRPGVSTVGGAEVTYYTIFTEVYVEAGATTQANMIGAQWTTTGSPPYVAPYAKQCTNTAAGGTYGAATYTPTNGGGLTVTATGNRGYPSIDYNDPNLFRPYSSGAGNQQAPNPTPVPTPAPTPNGNTEAAPSQGGPYTWTRGGGYPSINYDDPDFFRVGPGTGTYTQRAGPNTSRPPSAETAGPNTTIRPAEGTSRGPAPPPSGTGRPTSYPADYSDPNLFRPVSGIEIVSLTERKTLPPPTTTYTFGTSVYGANYNSIDNEATENFRPVSGVSIASLETPQTFPAPITTSIPVTSRVTSNYPSIDYANTSLFRPLDLGGGGGAEPASTVTSPVTSATSAA